MNYTSAQANKLLKKLNDEYTALLDKETRSRDFRAAMGEDVESVRPDYDYAETQIRLAELEAKIRKLKHAINIFNATQTVDSFDMTIDEMLVYIPQLTKRKSKLLEMKSRLPKERVEEQYGRQSNIIDYTYTNYDLAAVEADYEKTADELSRAQLALDMFHYWVAKVVGSYVAAMNGVDAIIFTAGVGENSKSSRAAIAEYFGYLGVTIDPEAVDPDDVEMLQDMIVAAVNEAMRKAEADQSANMAKLTGGLNLGGLF